MFGVSFGDILLILRLLRSLAGSATPAVVLLRDAALTVVLFTTLMVSVLSVREGGVQPALQLLLENKHAADAMQLELRVVARRDELIGGLLKAILVKAPTAARVRFAIIHNGEVGLTGVGLLRFDILAAVASEGYSVGPMITNGPLSDWSPYIGKLLAGECSHASLEDVTGINRMRMQELGASERLICPVTDLQGRLLGGLFVTWPMGVEVPHGVAMQALGEASRLIAAQIAAAMIATGEDLARASPA